MGVKNTDELMQNFNNRGFYYSKDLIFNYFLSLVTKPFVILTGISGSGKSKIAQLFAEIINNSDEKPYELIPVKPNWRDSKGLFGYHNLINDSYYITPTIQLFLRALKNPEHPFFLILDEMNIAKTEHYFADFLSLIESRRVECKDTDSSATQLKEVFSYPVGTKLSEAIILSALDVNKPSDLLDIQEFRDNRFSELWKTTIWKGADEGNWKAQFRTELNQKDENGNPSRLAGRVFEGGDGKYRLKRIADMSTEDAAIVEKLQKQYAAVGGTKCSIVQDNIILHNNIRCLSSNGLPCDCTSCPYVDNQKYKCDKLYGSGEFFVPPEIPIPLNVFTVGTVNVDETTYMFSPKVLDRSNVIEFNEVDFSGIYNLSEDNKKMIDNVSTCVNDNEFYFDTGRAIPDISITIPTKDTVNKFISQAKSEFDDLTNIFSVLKKYNLHFGYRVLNEISLYMCNTIENTSYANRTECAMDNQILQKILPKLFGSYDKLWNPLVEILSLLLKAHEQLPLNDIYNLISELKRISSGSITDFNISGTSSMGLFKYPKSAIKILDMLNDLNNAGFASFIK